jgi:hypothetical protein
MVSYPFQSTKEGENLTHKAPKIRTQTPAAKTKTLAQQTRTNVDNSATSCFNKFFKFFGLVTLTHTKAKKKGVGEVWVAIGLRASFDPRSSSISCVHHP